MEIVGKPTILGNPHVEFGSHLEGHRVQPDAPQAKILGAMMHPVVTVELGPMMLSDGLR